jgi:serine/threonine protein kinase
MPAAVCPGCQRLNPDHFEYCYSCGRSLSELNPGSMIAARYEVVGLLGKGGMGLVYRAIDTVLDEEVAIKVLRPDLGSNTEMVRRFRSEIKLARRVSHPNVARIHDYGEDAGLIYISMALLEGVDLKQLLADHPEGLPPEQAFDAVQQAAAGLKAIHDVGIIHRDLKTPNLILDPSGVVRLMDFGIAKEAMSRQRGLTATGEVIGSPHYMSPEQCQGKTLDLRSDLYALGIVAFELFTGQVPFQGKTLVETVLMQISNQPPFSGPIGSRIPPSAVPVLKKALAKAPEDRFASCGEMIEALRVAREGGAPDQRAERATPPAATPSPPAATPAADPTGPLQPPEERRAHGRLPIPLDVMLRRLDAEGALIEEERTVAENVSRRGIRVVTSMTAARVRDTVEVEELGGDFRSRAVVRYAELSGQIVRLGLEFTERNAPDRLVQEDELSTGRRGRLPTGARRP